eukprot:TRINITY_DN22182_c0_g1_i1.p1 TRINITY_DN22182_c0_g1~~TRINITY_DN22182_c0_g1_i1.p1  ORF type:complete len:322 (+),score=37.04 TRINITY_DN22182_c0_g1_i1:65-967(+)
MSRYISPPRPRYSVSHTVSPQYGSPSYHAPVSPVPVQVFTPATPVTPVHRQPASPPRVPVYQYRYSSSPSVAGKSGHGSQVARRNNWKLLTHNISQPCRSVNMAVDYLRLSVEQQIVDLFTGEHKTEEMLKQNPAGMVPALIEDHGDFVLNESSAILQYIAKGSTLLPNEHDEKAQIRLDSYLGYHLAQVRKLTTEAFLPIFFGKPEERPHLISEARVKCEPILTSMEGRLTASSYAAGNTLSIADFLLVAEVDQFNVVGLLPPLQYPAIHRYLGRMRRIPAYVESYAKCEKEIKKVLGL